MKNLIGISGKIGSGKDTFAEIIRLLVAAPYMTNQTVEHYLRNPNPYVTKTDWVVKKFANKLKEIASILCGVPAYKFEDQEFKKTMMAPEWDMTYREFLQKLGTDAMRNGLHTDTWVNATFANFNASSRWLITDVRFPNEAAAVLDKKGTLIRLERNSDTGDHPSETALDDFDFPIVIKNTGTLSELIDKARELCNELNLLNDVEEYPPHTEGFF
jgi:hypothetical protein